MNKRNYINTAQQALVADVAPARTDVYDRSVPDLVLTPPLDARPVEPPVRAHHVLDPMGGNIPADEPVFVLRGSDLSSPLILTQWIEVNASCAPQPLLAAAQEMVRRMQAWPERRAAGWQAAPVEAQVAPVEAQH